MVAGLVFGNLAYIFGRPLLSIYTDSTVSIEAGMVRLSIICTTYLLCGMMDTIVGSIRGMGYGVEEALAFAERGAARLGGKSHQRPVATRRQSTAGTGMSYRELADCRELFGNGLSDGELRELYQRVTR